LVSLTGRRIGDYLAAELRGQLLDRDVTVTVHDRMARGREQKVRRVEPVRFAGDRLALPETLAVPGHGPIRVELYLVPEGGEPGRVSVACGSTVVYDDLAAALEADLVQKLERAFRDLAREAPEYDFLAVRGGERKATGGPEASPGATVPEAGATAEEDVVDSAMPLLPAGPLARVEIVPVRARGERW